MERKCCCGDAADEHEETPSGYGACTVDGCPCVCYEADEEDEGDD